MDASGFDALPSLSSHLMITLVPLNLVPQAQLVPHREVFVGGALQDHFGGGLDLARDDGREVVIPGPAWPRGDPPPHQRILGWLASILGRSPWS